MDLIHIKTKQKNNGINLYTLFCQYKKIYTDIQLCIPHTKKCLTYSGPQVWGFFRHRDKDKDKSAPKTGLGTTVGRGTHICKKTKLCLINTHHIHICIHTFMIFHIY